ncbi:MAG: rhamnogalacturonan acetylesterase [Lachnospiraceae bacterium]|nr:rhamnogalacturonan acetylesterase [Lachnospiraceae bacterium]
MRTIHWAGDSTVAFNGADTYPQTGIGQALPLYLKRDVLVRNYAMNGRSTKSFMDEGRLSEIEKNIKEGDFLFIQFGHNDEKAQDAARYTTPYDTFTSNLEIYANVAKKVGAHPVFITPLERRKFVTKEEFEKQAGLCDGDDRFVNAEGGSFISPTHGDYPDAMLKFAYENDIPCLDLNKASRELMEEKGPEETLNWFMHVKGGRYPYVTEDKADNTHLRYEGAVVFAGIIAKELKELGGIYEDLVECTCNILS